MKKSLILIAAAAAFTSTAWADCNYPKAPAKIPDGNTAPREELLAAKKQVDQYNADMNTYLDCLKKEYDASVAKGGSSLTEQQKQQMAAMYTQKNDAAIDELTTVANRFNEQVRAYKAKNESK
ncbi:MAG: hypothetical protein QM696_14660 [Steroidobacteraceae bacterium]